MRLVLATCRIGTFVGVLTCSLLLCTEPAGASAVSATERVSLPETLTFLVPCAYDGAGALVTLSGTLTAIAHVTLDGHGGFTALASSQLSLIGADDAGHSYMGRGTERIFLHASTGSVSSTQFNVNLIGQGTSNDLALHGMQRVTVNANGDVTVFIDNETITCR
jgi:hypothetical protein